jgi:hypothetical protein
MSKEQLDALDVLIVQHIGDLDAAANRLRYEIQRKVGKKINSTVEEWCDDHGWYGKFDWNEDRLWLLPEGWRGAEATADDEDAIAYFNFGVRFGDDLDSDDGSVDYFWLTRLCKQGKGTIGFSFKREAGLGIKKKKLWIPLAAEHANKGSARALGFDYEEGDGTFFKALVIDKEALAKAIEEDDFAEALKPLRDALDVLPDAVADFQPLIDKAKAQASK